MGSPTSSRPAPLGEVGSPGLADPSTVAYRNYTNVTARFGRGYQRGDTLIAGWADTITADTVDIDVLAERVFARHNRDDRPDGHLCPSMSVGDVVVIGEVAVTVEAVGFSICSPDPADVVADTTWRDYLDRHPDL